MEAGVRYFMEQNEVVPSTELVNELRLQVIMEELFPDGIAKLNSEISFLTKLREVLEEGAKQRAKAILLDGVNTQKVVQINEGRK